MATSGDSESVFAKYIETPKKDRPREPIQTIQEIVTNLAAQHQQAANARAFLLDVLANGPMQTTIIEELGAARGFNSRQLRRAKERTGIVAFKKKGKVDGPWLWTTPQHAPEKVVKLSTPSTRRLRNISHALGFRLERIGKCPREDQNHPAAPTGKSQAGQFRKRHNSGAEAFLELLVPCKQPQ